MEKERQEPVKIIASIVLLIASLGVMINSFWPQESQQLVVKLKSLWPLSDDNHSQSPENPQDVSSVPETTVNNMTGDGSISKDAPTVQSDENQSSLLAEELFLESISAEEILLSQPAGVRSGQGVLDALGEIESWSSVEGGFNPERLRLYLRYPKLWVQISAFAFALKSKSLNSTEEAKTVQLIRDKSKINPSQVSRFLLRYQSKDPALFEELKHRLFDSGLPIPDNSTSSEIDEDSDDAS
jgi:hypothetical protein